MAVTTKQRWILGLTSVGSLMVALDVLVVTTALDTIRRHLGASIGQLEWTVNAYSLSFAVLLMTGAAIGDRFGRRRLFAVGLGLFSLASVGCALAPSIGWLIAARAIQGVGGALVLPLSLALLSEAFPPERRGWAIGIFSAITGLAVLGGPVVGGAITQGIAWQWIFWLNVPIGLIAVLLVMGRMDESFGPRVSLDVPGLLLITGAGFGLVWGLIRANRAGWGSFEVIFALAAGISLLVAFVAVELRAREPMLPMRLFAGRAFAAGNAANFLLQTSLFGAVFFMAQFQQVGLGQGPLAAGLRLLPWTSTLFVVAPVAGALIDRIGSRSLIVTGLALQAGGVAWIAAIAHAGMGYTGLILPMIIAGAGVSMAIPATQSVVVNSVAEREIGKASGTVTTMRQLGAVFGLAIAVTVFAGAGSYASPAAFTDGFVPALAVSAGLALLGSLVALAIPSRAEEAAIPAALAAAPVR